MKAPRFLFEFRARVLHPRAWAIHYWEMVTRLPFCWSCRETYSVLGLAFCWVHNDE